MLLSLNVFKILLRAEVFSAFLSSTLTLCFSASHLRLLCGSITFIPIYVTDGKLVSAYFIFKVNRSLLSSSSSSSLPTSKRKASEKITTTLSGT